MRVDPFRVNSSSRIEEVLYLCAEKGLPHRGRVELLGKGGRKRRIRALRQEQQDKLDLARPYEAQPWFRATLRFRAGIEGRISGLARWLGWGVIVNREAWS